MKKNFLILLIMSFLMIGSVACSNDEAANGEGGIKTMTGQELVKQNSDKKKDEVLIIDVRSDEEYKAGHIPHAINIFVDDMESHLAEIEDYKDKPVILYCNSGSKSQKAAEILVDNGFKDVTNAAGVKEFQYDLVHYKDVRGSEFKTIIEENKDIVIVDVRPEDQAKEEGMIEEAINIPFDSVEANLEQLPEDKTIALYCNTGTKSAGVAAQLEELGYENVINSIEGVNEYSFDLVNK